MMKLQHFCGIYNQDKHKVFALCGIKIKVKRRQRQTISSLNKKIEELEHRLLLLEMDVVRNSGLWDAKYYIEHYHPDMKKQEALRYYTAEGFKHKETPSALFDTRQYWAGAHYLNPVIEFVLQGRYHYSRGFQENKYPVTEEAIAKYWTAHDKRKSKKVMYTCITNNYDNLHMLKGFTYTDDSWDYVAFTDNRQDLQVGRVGIWQTRPLVFQELDNSRNNRWHKIHPHLLFPEYEESIYIDADINILTSKFFNLVNHTDKIMLLPIHADRVDLYKEILWAAEMGFDSEETARQQYALIQKTGFPKCYGMPENNIIYRKHQLPEMIQMMNEWWFFVKNYSRRDQTSLAYLMWKHGMKVEDYTFENTRIDYRNFCIYKHQKGYDICKS